MPVNSNVPTRKTSEHQLNQWNQALRASPIWQQWMRQNVGLDPDGATRRNIKLSDQQQEALERHLAANGIRIPDGMHIDPAGNLNQKNRLVRNLAIGAAIGGGALTGLGLAGIGPLSGLGGAASGAGAAGAGGAAAGGVLPSASIAGLHTAVPATIASQGISSALGTIAPTVAGGAGAAGAARGAGSALAGAGKSVLDNLTSAEGIASLAAMIPALAAGGSGGGGDVGGVNQDFLNRAYEDAKRTNAMQDARFRRVDPLHEAVAQLAFSRLPDSARQGITLPRVPLPPQG